MLKRCRNTQMPTALSGAIAVVLGLVMFIPLAQAERIVQQNRSPQFKMVSATLCGLGAGVEIVDLNTQRNGMHCCPLGMFVTGVHIAQNKLLCAGGVGVYSEIDEIVDTNTQFYRAYPEGTRTGMRNWINMHTCPRGWAVTGIHVARNLLA